jgi:hypothetical protein
MKLSDRLVRGRFFVLCGFLFLLSNMWVLDQIQNTLFFWKKPKSFSFIVAPHQSSSAASLRTESHMYRYGGAAVTYNIVANVADFSSGGSSTKPFLVRVLCVVVVLVCLCGRAPIATITSLLLRRTGPTTTDNHAE